MKKRNLVCVLLSIIILMAAIPSVAAASESADYYPTSITSNSISDLFKELKLRTMVFVANARIYSLVRYAQSTPYDDVDWLLNEVDKIIKPVFAYAESIGATVVCEYIPYMIDGREVLIDPLKVINI